MAIPPDRVLTCSLEAFLDMQDEHFEDEKYMPVGVSFEGNYSGTLIHALASIVPDDAIVVVDYRQSVAEYHKSAQGTALVPKNRGK